MSDVVTNGGSASETKPVATTAQGTDGGSAQAAAPEWKAREEVLADLVKQKTRVRELEENLKKQNEDKLKANSQWEELAKAKEQEATQWKDRYEKTTQSFVDAKKYEAVRTAAMKLGLRSEAVSDLDLVELSGVVVETTSTGKINILGHDSFAERLKSQKPHWFQAAGAPNIHSGNPRVVDTGGGTITAKMVLEAEKEGQKKGDLTQYHTMVKQYRLQRQAGG